MPGSFRLKYSQMDSKIVQRFHDGILTEAARRYGVEPGKVRLLDGFESFMYELERSDGTFILRIGHSLRRTPDLVRGEVDWINYLAAGGVGVARAILSQAGNLVELISDGQGGEFICTGFVRASGATVTRDQLTDHFYRNYGRLLGRMHALAKKYALPNPAWKRPEWDDPLNLSIEDRLPGGESGILERYLPLKAHLVGLPRERDGYGMIHQDAHPGNFFVDNDLRITLFDFDDCCYGHFIYDIAMALFYTSMWGKDTSEFTNHFMPAFLEGYREENRLEPAWLAELPNFLKLREIDLYAQIRFSYGDKPLDPWPARYMLDRKEKIEAGRPYIEYEWGRLRDSL